MRNLLTWTSAILVFAVLPWLVPSAWVIVLSKMLIAALFAMAFNLLSGQAGMLSFGHAAYFGVGTFATLHLMQAAESGLGIPTPLLPLAGLVAGLLFGLVCGLFATLRSGVYFSMITLAISELLFNLAPNLEGVFGGEGGVSSFRMPWLGFTFGSDLEVYYLVAGWTISASLALYLYTKTPFGTLTIALRENEQRVRFLGYNSYLSRVLIFSLSAMFAGLAGGLNAVTNESANYVLFETGVSASVVFSAFIGGTGVFLGPAVGAVLLSAFTHLVSDLTPLSLLYQGIIFIVVMIYLPKGILGSISAAIENAGSNRGRHLLFPVSLVFVSTVAVSLAAVFTVEITQRFFSAEHLGRRDNALVPVEFVGRMWSLQSPLTWFLAIALWGGGIWLFRSAIRMSREARGASA